MNAVEIEMAVSALAIEPFEGAEFPFSFLEAFGNKETTIRRLRKGDTNESDVPGGMLQRNNIHIAACDSGDGRRKPWPRSAPAPRPSAAKAKFILATDGDTSRGGRTGSGETIACAYADFAESFGVLPAAGRHLHRQGDQATTPFDVRATGGSNKLYIELLKDNPEWGTEERRQDMNHFMARLIFCFFAEDTDIFNGIGLFTSTIEQMSAQGLVQHP